MTIVGKVVALTGTAYIIKDNGDKRELQLGDTVQTSDTIQTVAGAEVELDMTSGRVMRIGPEQLVAFTPELTNALGVDALDSEVNLATIETVIKAIESGKDINAVLEETAAGSGSRVERGFDFVNLMRIIDPLNQFGFNYDFEYRANIDDQPISGRLIDDDANRLGAGGGAVIGPLNLQINDVTRNESAGTITFTVSLTRSSVNPVTVDYATVSDTATVGVDVLAGTNPLSGTLTFAPGQLTQTITLNINNDALFEGAERFNVNLTNPTGGALIIDNQGVGTIRDDGAGDGGTDNDFPAISITGLTNVNEGIGTITYTVTLSNPSSQTVTVNYGTASGTATSGSDFTATTGTLTFLPDQTSQTFTVAITEDTVFEGPEAFTVNLSAPTNATIATGSVTTTIQDDGTGTIDDPLNPAAPPPATNDVPQVTAVSSPTVTEGGNLNYTVTLSNASTTATIVTLTPASGTGILGTDTTTPIQVSFDGGTTFTTVTGATVSVPAGTTSFITRIPTLDDTLGEGGETILLNAGTTRNPVPVQGTGTITDNDTPNITINDVTRNEGAGTITFTVSLTIPSSNTVTVDYAAVSGTATVGTDVTAGTSPLSGTVSFAPNQLTQTITLNITDDAVFEGSESFNINLSNPTGGALIGDAQGVGTILDDGTGGGGTTNDVPQVTAVSSPTVTEGGNLNYTVTLSNASTTATIVTLTPASGTGILGTDTTTPIQVSFDGGTTFTTVTGATVSVPAGTTSFITRIPTFNDTISELSETILLSASTPRNIAAVQGTGTITDNDGTPTLSITGLTNVNEGIGTITYTVTLSNPSSQTVTVNYGTASGTATSGSDFTATTGTLTFLPDQTSQTFTVAITEDTVFEGPEAFTVNLSAPTNATIATGSVTTTIQDDGTGTIDDPLNPAAPPPATNDVPQVTAVSSPTVTEGGNLNYTVTLSNASTTATIVTLTPASGTGILGTDTTTPIQVSFDGGTTFTTVTGATVSVPAGTTSFITRIPTFNDTISELSETILLSASTPRNIAAVQGTGTITDNDGTPTLSITGLTNVNEGIGTITYTVTLSNPSSQTVTVNYGTASGTATSGSDFTATTGTLTFLPDQTSQTFTVAITEDTVFEGPEAFTVNLSAPTNATIATGSVTTTIQDDGTGTIDDPLNPAAPPPATNDVPQVTAVSSPTVTEGGNLNYTVTLSNASTTATIVTLTPASGTGILGTDTTTPIQVSFDGGTTFTTVTGATVSVPAGTTSFITRIPTLDDTLGEGGETILLNAGTTRNPVPVQGTGTITDNDTPNITINDVTRNEGAGTITFTVSLTIPSSNTVTVDYAAVSGTATVGTDVTAGTSPLSGTVSFAPNQLTQTITLNITDDAVFEGSESFNINLSNPTGGALIGDAQGVGTILDDGTGGGGTTNDVPQVTAVSSPTVTEGGNLNYTVTLSNASTTATIVTLTPASGTGILGTDTTTPIQVSFDGGTTFTTVTGATVSVPAGTTSFITRIPTFNDTISELSETILLSASTPRNIAAVQGTGTITDNDGTPTLSITGLTNVNEGIGTITYTVTLSNPSSQTVTVNYGTASGTATSGSDFTATTGTLTFLPDQTSQTFTVAITEDTVFEGPEAFTVNLSAPTNATIATGSVTTTIQDDGTGTIDDPLNPAAPPPATNDVPQVTAVSSPTVTEGGNLNYTVTLSNASTTATIVTLTPASGTGILGTDTTTPIQVSFDGGTTFTTVTGATVSVPAGTTSFITRIPTFNDTISELSETILLSASTPRNIAAVQGTGTITDNDGTPTLSITGLTNVNEGIGTITYTVTLSNPSSQTVTVNYGTASGTATSGSDFTATTGTLTFLPDQTSQTFTVAITEDTVFEGPEAFTVNLSAPTNATIATGSVTTTIQDDGTGTIDDPLNPAAPPPATNDVPQVTAVSSPTVTEGGNLNYTVTLSNASTTATIVTLTPASGTGILGTDTTTPIQVSFDGGTTFTTVTGATVSVPAGTTSFITRIPTFNDTISELSETILLSASTPRNIAAVQGTGTITDNDGTPTLSITGLTNVNEGIGTITYTVTLSNPSSQTVTVNYGTASGTATSGSDFTATTGTLTFLPDQTSQTFTVAITEDTVFEGPEAFTVNLSAPTNATIATGSVTTTIQDDGTGTIDDPLNPAAPPPATNDVPQVTAVSSPTVTEGGNLNYTVTLSNASTTATIVTLTPASGTGILGTDTTTPIQVSFDGGTTFTTVTGATVSVPAGTTSFITRIPTFNDTISELSETILLSASTPRNIAAVQGTGTITDNDGTPTLSITGLTNVNEGIGTITYTVTLSNPSSQTVTVNYGTASGTATSGSDFTATTGTLTFLPDQTSQTFTVAITEDTVFEGPEAFTVNLSAPTNATIATGSVTTTIQDDGTGTIDDPLNPAAPPPATNDVPQVTAVSSPTVTEGGNLNYTVTLSNASTTATIVTLTPASGTGILGTDTTTPIQVSFDGGTTFTTVTGATVSVPAGTTSFITRIPTVDDTIAEGSETILLSASTLRNIAPITGTGTIGDNEPTVDLDGNNSSGALGSNYTTTFTENGSAVSIADTDIVVASPVSTTMASATITLTNAQAGDVLAAVSGGGITASVVGNVVTLTGIASLAQYQTAIRAVTFSNSTDTPNTTPRLINVVLNDGANTTNTAVATVNVVAVNDTPTITPLVSIAVTEDVATRLTGLNFGDVDAGTGNITVTLSVPAGTLTATSGAGVTVGGSATEMTLTGTLAAINNFVSTGSGVFYTTVLNVNGTINLTVNINDLGNTGTDPGLTGTTTNEQATLVIPLNISPTNDTPIAVTDNYTMAEDGAAITLTPLTGDSDPDGTTPTIQSINGTTLTPGVAQTISVTGGTVNITAGGVITFTPALNFNGTVTFPYVITDGTATSTANQVITVTPVNDTPIAVTDNYTMAEDGAAITLTPLTGDSDPDGTTPTIQSINGTTLTPGVAQTISVTGGTVNITAGGVITFTPALNFNGTVTFPYVITDGTATSTANQVITVTPVNDTPIAVTDNYTMAEDGAAITLTPLTGDSDPDGTTPTIQSINGTTLTPGVAQTISVTGGTVNITAGGVITFTPALNFNGTVTFPYVITDGTATSTANQVITVTPVNDAPVDGNETNTVIEDTTLTVADGAAGDLLNNATDVDGNPLTITGYTIAGIAGTQAVGAGVLIPSVGTITINANGSYSFAPVANYTGAIPVITYTVSDGTLTDTSTLTLSITPVNDTPIAVTDNYTMAEDGAAITLTPLTGDSDPDGTTPTIQSINGTTLTPGVAQTISVTGGTVNITAGGVITFTPALNFNGTVTFPYVITDGTATSTANQVITVTPVNDTPIAVTDNYTMAEDGAAITLTPLTGDSDPDGTTPTIQSINGTTLTPGVAQTISVTGGTVNITAGGVITFTPALNFNGTVTFPYVITDGTATSTANQVITVTPVNDTPIAVTDNYTMAEDGAAITLTPLTGDSDPDGTTPTIQSINGTTLTPGVAQTISVTGGTVNITAGGVITFTPALNFNGTVTFPYVITDGTATSTANQVITVTPVNDAPVDGNETNTVIEDTTLTVADGAAGDLLNNATDVDGNPLTITGYTIAGIAGTQAVGAGVLIPSVGTITINANGSYSFAPVANYTGAIPVITYTVSDGTLTDTSTLTLSITPVNDTPIAVTDNYTMAEDGAAITLTPLTGDSDPDGTTPTIQSINGTTLTPGVAQTISVTGGTVNITAGGVITFTPALNFNGTVTFPYVITDGTATSTANQVITVTPVNDTPIAVTDNYTMAEDGAAITLTPLTGDSDPDGTTPTIQSINGTTLTPGVAQTISVTGGTVNITAGGVITFTPALNFNGTVTFPYVITDGTATSTANQVITVTPVNDTPIAVTDNYTMAEDGAAITLTPLTGDSDPDGTTPTIQSINGTTLTPGVAQTISVTGGTVNITAGGVITFTPALNFNGTVTFPYVITDGTATSTANQVITVTPVNDAPVDGNETNTVIEDTTLTVADGAAGDLLNNATDVDGNPLTITGYTIAGIAGTQAVGAGVLIPSVGTITINANGSYSFAPVANYTGAIPVITYTVSDGTLTDTSTLTLSITPVNDTPIAVTDNYTMAEDGAAITLTPLTGDSDPDGTTPTIQSINGTTLTPGVAQTISVTGGTVNITAGGVITFTPALNFNGTVTFPYVITDGTATSTANQVITVTPVNDTPIAVTDNYTMAEDGAAITLTPLTGDSDPDGTTPTIQSINGTTLTPGVAQTISVTGGTVNITAGGVITFTPALNFNGTVTFPYVITDGTATSTANQVITVTPVNDAPVDGNETNTVIEDTTLTVADGAAGDLLNNATDVDGNPLTITGYTIAGIAGTQAVGAGVLIPSVGTITINANGSYSFAPVANYTGAIPVITYTVSDGTLTDTSTLTLSITPVNDTPIAVTDNYTMAEDGAAITLTPLTGDSDPDGTTPTIQSINGTTLTPGVAQTISVTGGTVNITAGGVITFTPALNFNGTVTFPYVITDGTATSTANQVITVTPVNDTPIAVTDNYTMAEDGAAITLTPLTGDSDPDGTTPTIQSINGTTLTPGVAQTISVTGGTVNITAGGVITFTPALNFNGTVTFPYVITDGTATSTANQVITVTPVNDAPVIAAAGQSVGTEDTPLTITWSSLGTIIDVDSPATNLSIIVNTLPADGVLTLGGVAVTAGQTITKAAIDAGSLVFTPDANESGINAYTATGVGNLNQTYATFVYQLSDGALTSNTATYGIDINPVVDAPNLTLENAAGIDLTIYTPPTATGLTVNQYLNTPLIDTTVAVNITSFEAAIEASTPTSTFISTNPEIGFAGTDTAVRMTGYIYMEAGSTYNFSGTRDDTFLLKVGGVTLQADPFDSWGAFNATTYTPTVSGYYSIEVNYYNGALGGYLDMNLSVDGAAALSFDTSNFNIYASPSDFSASAGVGGRITVNDGGYYPTQITTNTVMLGDITASLNDVDGSESLVLVISTLPVGTTISDGVNTFTAVTGNTSVNVTTWNVNNITLTLAPGWEGAFDVTVTAISTEINGASASTVGTIRIVANSSPNTTVDTNTDVEGTTTLNASVLANDSDIDGNPLTVSQFATNATGLNSLSANGSNTVTTALGGRVVMNADGTYTYTAPVRDHSDAIADVDTFAYRANDGSLNSAWTTVSIIVTDTGPVAINDLDSVGIGSTVTGNVITGAGGVTADTLNVDGPHSLTNVVLTAGTSADPDGTVGAGNVRTIVTTRGILVIDQDDGSYTYTATVAPIVVSNPTGLASFTSAGIGLFGFDTTEPYTTANNPGSGLNLANLNATSAGLVRFVDNLGEADDGVGVEQLAGSSVTNALENTEQLVIQLGTGVTSRSVSLALNSLSSAESVVYDLYTASGAFISTSSAISGSGTGTTPITVNISSGTPFAFVVIRPSGTTTATTPAANFRVDGITVIPEQTGVSDVFTYTLTDSDGDTSNATLTVNYDTTATANNDLAQVFEAGINENGAQNGGTQEAQTIERATGNILGNDTGVSSFSNLTISGGTITGGSVVASAPNGNGVVTVTVTDTAGARTIATITVFTQDFGTNVKGDYVVDLVGRTTDGAGTNDSFTLNYTLTNSVSGEVDSATLTVDVVDDVPAVQDAIVQVQQGVLPRQNLIFVIDSSGSMAGEVKNVAADGTVTIINRLQATQLAVAAVINEYFSQGGNVSVTLIDFDDTATNRGTFTTAAAAIQALNDPVNFTVLGGTNYELALNAAQTAIGTPVVGESYTTYFISDGVPLLGDTTDPAANPHPTLGVSWRNFTTTNNITTYAIGIASGISDSTELNNIHNVDSDDSGVKDNAIIVTNVALLDDVLLASVPTTFGGSVAGSAANSSLNFGADGGYISQLIMRLDTNGDNVPDSDVTFNFNPTTGVITVAGGGAPQTGFPLTSNTLTLNNANGFEDGILIFNFRTGEYVYQTSGFATEGDQFDIRFTATDSDGDTASGRQTVQIVDGKPDANNDIDTLRGGQTFFEGNVISAIGTDGGDSVALTSFSTNRSGEDNPGDAGDVSSIVFKGITFDLTTLVTTSTAVATSVPGSYTITDINGVRTLTWTATTGGAALVFNEEGYYRYTPPTAEISNNVVGILTPYDLNSAANIATAAAAGMTLSAIGRNSTAEGTGTVTSAVSGAGVNDNGTNTSDNINQIDDLESLVITFNTAIHPRGVRGVTIDVDTSSNLGGTQAFNYTIYDVHGDLIGQFASNLETPISIPPTGVIYEGIGKIVIDSGSINGGFDANAGSILSVSYQSIFDTGISVADVSVDEGAGTVTITVSLSQVSSQTVTVNYATAAGTAAAVTDFTATSGTLTFAPGTTTQTFTVPIVDSAAGEGLETFVVNLTNAVNAVILDNQSTVTIGDDDTVGSTAVLVSNPVVTEGGFAQFTVTFTRTLASATTFTLATTAGTAAGTDYAAPIQYSIDNGVTWLTYPSVATAFAAGLNGFLVRVQTTGDSIVENTETFNLNVVRTAGGAVSGVVNGVASIIDNDAVSVAAPEVITYTITDTDGDTSSATLTLNNIADDLVGSAANNTINGSARNDNISGLAGDDNISVGAGFDIVRGGDGNDTIDGGADDDQLYGNAGNDNISGGTGNDLMFGDAGNDTLTGNDGDDFISGGDGTDTINGGIGADIIIGGVGNDILTGGAGVDVFRWELNDRGTTSSPATDTITDFDPAAVGGDVLDLRDLLTGEQHVTGTGNLTSYLHFELVGVNTILHVSNNGAYSNGYSPTKDVQRITLTGVDLVTGFADDQAIIQNLLTNNKLIVD